MSDESAEQPAHGTTSAFAPWLIGAGAVALAGWGAAGAGPGLLPPLAACLATLPFLAWIAYLRRSGWRWRDLAMAAFVVSFSAALFGFGRSSFLGIEFPLFLLLLPLLAAFRIADRNRPAIRPSNLAHPLSLEAWLLALFFAFLLASALVSDDLASNLTVVAKLCVYFFSYILFSSMVDSAKLLRRLLGVFTLAMAATLAVAFYYHIFQPMHWYRLTASEEISPNLYGMMLILPFLILLGLSLTAQRLTPAIAYGAASGIFATGLLLTHSRGAWLSAFVGVAVLCLLIHKRIRLARAMGLVILAAIVFAAAAPMSIKTRFVSIWSADGAGVTPASNVQRIRILEYHLNRVASSPWAGSGFKSTTREVPGVGVRSAHNSFLTIWGGAGVGALASFLAFLTVHVFNLRSMIRSKALQGIWSSVVIAAFAAMVAELMVGDFVLGYLFWQLMAFQGAALAAAAGAESRSSLLVQVRPSEA